MDEMSRKRQWLLAMFRIWSVALYEMKALMRNWAFYFVVFYAILFTALPLIYSYTEWTARAVPSMLPYLTLVYVSLILAAGAVILSVESFTVDQRNSTAPILQVRPISNGGYLFGKLLGILLVFMGLTGVCVLATGVFVAVFLADTPVVRLAYIAYPLIMILPMLVLLIGLALLLIAGKLSRSFSLFLLLTYVMVMVFSGESGWHHLLDFRGVRIPLLYSGFTGFGNLGDVFLQRGMYLLLGIGFACLGVAFASRLSQSRLERPVALMLALACLGAAFAGGKTILSKIDAGREFRSEIDTLNNRLSGLPRITLDSCRIDLAHHGKEIEVTVLLCFTNRTTAPLDRYVFSLNPGLRVTEIRGATGTIPFRRNHHILTITPAHPLVTGGADSLSIRYRGSIDESACYADIPEAQREMDNSFNWMFIDKRYAFIDPRYVLLTREALWYPIPGVPPGSGSPRADDYDFSRYTLKVKTVRGLTAISQGRAETAGDGVFRFLTETPLRKISLVIGPYLRKNILIDGVEYSLYLRKGHDFISPLFTTLSRPKLIEIIREARKDMEGGYGLSYPFPRFSLVETPAQFLAHPRLRSKCPETLQPEQVLLSEGGIFIWGGYLKDLLATRSKFDTRVLTPEEVREESFRNFIHSTFTYVSLVRNRMAKYRELLMNRNVFGQSWRAFKITPFDYSFAMTPQFLFFRNEFYSDHFPLFSLALMNYLESDLPGANYGGASPHLSTPDNEIASRELIRNSLTDIFSDPKKEMIAGAVLPVKSEMLFSLLKARMGGSNDRFNSFLRDFIEKNSFRRVPAESLLAGLKEKYGGEVDSLFYTWMNGRGLPRYVTSNARYTESPEDRVSRYRFCFTIQNTESAEGVIKVYFGYQNITGDYENVIRLISVKGKEIKEIGFAGDQPLRSVFIDTILSQHIPKSFGIEVKTPERVGAETAFNGERVVNPSRLQSGEMTVAGSFPDSVFIVDNLDPGFHILPGAKPKLAEQLRNRMHSPSMKEVGMIDRLHPPEKWRLAVDGLFYGAAELSAYYIRAGTGIERVRWETRLLENGVYRVFYYNRYYWSKNHYVNDASLKELHFQIQHADGISEEELTDRDEYGWALLGEYRFNKGPTWVELSDKTSGKFVYADAVKWVKR